MAARPHRCERAVRRDGEELITATGNTFEHPPANYYRIAKDPYALAESTAQLFLGVRMQCAKCHNHPFERWTQDDYYGFATWFARVKTKPAGGKPNADRKSCTSAVTGRSHATAHGQSDEAAHSRRRGSDRAAGRPAPGPGGLADGREAIRSSPSPSSIASGSTSWARASSTRSMTSAIRTRRATTSCSTPSRTTSPRTATTSNASSRTIMKSQTYHRSAMPNESNADDDKYFSHAVTKLLTAEPLLDAICDVTGVPEKFAGLPAGTRAMQLPDGEVNHPFLKTFGQPARELACECERESDGNLGQALQLINGPTVNEKVRAPGNRLRSLLWSAKSDREKLTELYLRRPVPPAE